MSLVSGDSEKAAPSAREALMEMVLSGEIEIGSRLPSERELAARLGVSRGTVREALRELAAHGSVTSSHGSAWYLDPIPEPVIEALTVQLRLHGVSWEKLVEGRDALEPHAAALAAEHRTPSSIGELERCFAHMVDAEDDERYLDADVAFHEALARATENPFFVMAITPLLLALRLTREQSLKLEPERRRLVLAEHRRILESVLSRDPDGAAEAMKAHLASFAGSVGTNGPDKEERG